ncbi:MAG: ABC transporter ATP-binding protein [Clostridia bacterium]
MNKYERKNRRFFIGLVFCAIFAIVFAVIGQFFKGYVLDNALAGNGFSTLNSALFLIGSILLEVFFYYLYDRIRISYSTGCERALREDFFRAVLNRSYIAFKAQNSGDYIAKFTNNLNLISDMRFTTKTVLVMVLSRVVLVSVALFLLDWRIAIVTLLLLTTPLYIPKLVEKRLAKAQTDYTKAVEENLSKFADWLNGFELIKNFSIEKRIFERFCLSNDSVANKQMNRKRLSVIMTLITTLISYLSYFIILAFSAYLVFRGDFSAGGFFVAIGMIDQLSYPLISLSELVRNLLGVKPICKNILEFIGESNPTFCQNYLSLPLRTHLKNEIMIADLSFSHDEKPLLSHFSMRIKAGSRYLIQGASGSGKTTLTNLLLRYYEATDGTISIDGKPISDIDVYALMTVVRQDPVLFNDTLKSNLTMYSNFDDELLISLLKRVKLDKFASKDGLLTIIDEGGKNLSGGERKRVSILRALLRDTDILIFDEPLANLDTATAISIEDELLNIVGRTVIVVSHEFSSEKLHAFDEVITIT